MPIVNALDDPLTRVSHAATDHPQAHVRHCWAWEPGQAPNDAWRDWARDTSVWLHSQGVAPRDAWIVLPVGALLAQARRAWAQAVGGWLPRIDTIAGLVASLGWAHASPPWSGPLAEAFTGPVTLDAALDRLQARRTLGVQTWARQWALRDARGFDFAVGQVVDAAQTWLRVLQACPPSQRDARVSAWRDAISEDAGASGQVPGGAGHREALLLAWALEWASASAQLGFASDVVFGEEAPAGGGPAAWVAVTAGDTVAPGSEGALTLAAMAHAASQGVPVLQVVATPVCVRLQVQSAEQDVHQGIQQGAQQGPESARLSPVEVRVSLLACRDTLDEARQAAAATLLAVNAVRQGAGEAPEGGQDGSWNDPSTATSVALIALDRSVLRHVRALLEHAGVSLADETGWRLSTTRAASVISRMLAASSPRASTDDVLDWLKSGWLRYEGLDEAAFADAVGQLEAWCRRHGLVSAAQLCALAEGADATDHDSGADGLPGATYTHPSPHRQRGGAASTEWSLPPAASALWHWTRAVVAPLQMVWRDRQAHLAGWLGSLHEALAACGAKLSLLQDEAGQLAWAALRLDEFLPHGVPIDVPPSAQQMSHWQTVCQQTRIDGANMQRWVRELLEDVTFRPTAPEGRADVVITTLARAALRPFAAIVMPGADERQLGALPTSTSWLGQRAREAMGLATALQLRQAQWEALQLLLTQPRVTCLYRKAQGSEPLEPSPWLARWAQSHLSGAGHATSQEVPPSATGSVAVAIDPRSVRRMPATPVLPPQPTMLDAPVALPSRVSATTYEQLRQCPYRFFAATVLGLRQADELQEGLEASDYGTWLHEVLRRFHAARQEALANHVDHEHDEVQWLAVAHAVSVDMGMLREGQRAHFLPYAAALPALAHAYVSWLRKHEAEGWSVRATEVHISRELPLSDGSSVHLHGQLDRIDVRHEHVGEGEPQREVQWVLDYKTGNAAHLAQRAKAGKEDTQLAFYAALGAADSGLEDADSIRAGYVHLDPKAVKLLEHADVADSALGLLQGLASDWQRLREGSAMLALGEGTVCGHCHVRGLCRRDHWADGRLSDQANVSKGG